MPTETASSPVFAAALLTRGRVQFLRGEHAKTFATLKLHDQPNIFDHGQIVPTGRNGLATWQQVVVVAYIERHIAESIRICALARFVYLSSDCFCRAFKRSFGMPPHHYLVQRRTERAKVLLTNSTWPIIQIALALGFRQRSSFSAAFRRVTGISPTEYRRTNR
jgi:AraC-like DNA-binding protein